jgi:hypothetical protein
MELNNHIKTLLLIEESAISKFNDKMTKIPSIFANISNEFSQEISKIP